MEPIFRRSQYPAAHDISVALNQSTKFKCLILFGFQFVLPPNFFSRVKLEKFEGIINHIWVIFIFIKWFRLTCPIDTTGQVTPVKWFTYGHQFLCPFIIGDEEYLVEFPVYPYTGYCRTIPDKFLKLF